jgi:hypothetical protein
VPPTAVEAEPQGWMSMSEAPNRRLFGGAGHRSPRRAGSTHGDSAKSADGIARLSRSMAQAVIDPTNDLVQRVGAVVQCADARHEIAGSIKVRHGARRRPG